MPSGSWGTRAVQGYNDTIGIPGYWENKSRYDKYIDELNNPALYDDNSPGNQVPVLNAFGIRPDEVPILDRIKYNLVGDLPSFDPSSMASWKDLGIDPAQIADYWRYDPGKITGGPTGAYSTVGYTPTDTASFEALQRALSGQGIPKELLNNWIGQSGVAINRSMDAAKRQAAEDMARRGLYSAAPGMVTTSNMQAALKRGELLGMSASDIMKQNAILGNQNMMTAIPIELQRLMENAAGQTAASKYTAEQKNLAESKYFDWLMQKALTEGNWANEANKDSMLASMQAQQFNAGQLNNMNLAQYQAALQGQLNNYGFNVEKTFKNTDISNKQIDTNLGQSNSQQGMEWERKKINANTQNQVNAINNSNTINRQNRDWAGNLAAKQFTIQQSNPLGWANLNLGGQTGAANSANIPPWWQSFAGDIIKGAAGAGMGMIP